MNTNKWELSHLEASWLLNELEHSAALPLAGNGDEDRLRGSRREMASQLLEELERSKTEFSDAPPSGWLEERVELDLFGEVQPVPFASPLEIYEPQEFTSSPSSPINNPASPSFTSGPGSPVKGIKVEEEYQTVDDDELLQTFEDIFLQLQQEESSASQLEAANAAQEVLTPVSPFEPVEEPLDQVSFSEDDVATALLQSLIEGNNASATLQVQEVLDRATSAEEPSTPVFLATPSGRRRSARAKAQPYPLPDKLQSAPSGAGAVRETEKEEPNSGAAPRSRRGRRASLPVEDRKLRKKEQNKTAAIRYRQKKKAETEELASIEQSLEDRNKELQKRHDDLAHEVLYLKKLMREVGILA